MSKRILVTCAKNIGEGNFSDNNIYNIIEDRWFIDNENSYKYSETVERKYRNGSRHILVEDNDNNKVDIILEYYNKNLPQFIIYDDDKELAYKLIKIVDGLDSAIVNLALTMQK